MRRVPAIDATGLHALDEFLLKCRRQHTTLLLAGIHAQPLFALTQYGLLDKFGEQNLHENIDSALAHAATLTGHSPPPKPAEAQPEVARETPKTPDQ
jgi:SulP family sulfate permease